MRGCFYCDRHMVSTRARSKLLPASYATEDHVYPANTEPGVLSVNAPVLYAVYKTGQPWRHHIDNKVTCCHDCNRRKMDKQPQHWLTSLTSDAGAYRLGMRLVKLGSDPDIIQALLAYRNRRLPK